MFPFWCFLGTTVNFCTELSLPQSWLWWNSILGFSLLFYLCLLINHTKKKYECSKSRTVIMRFCWASLALYHSMASHGFLLSLLYWSRDNDANFSLQLIFTVVSSLQGLFLFIFFCVIGKDSREAWREFLCQGRVRTKLITDSHSRGNHGTMRPSTNTLSSLLRQAGSSALHGLAYQSKTNSLSDFSSPMRTLEHRMVISRELDSSLIMSTLDHGAINFGSIPFENPYKRIQDRHWTRCKAI